MHSFQIQTITLFKTHLFHKWKSGSSEHYMQYAHAKNALWCAPKSINPAAILFWVKVWKKVRKN